MTFGASTDNFAVWSLDSSKVIFRRAIDNTLVLQSLTTGAEDIIPVSMYPTDWSRDGRYLLGSWSDRNTGLDIWALDLQGDRKPFLIVQTPLDERDPQFSPDGHWIAFQQSNESGQFDLYVQPFPKGAKTQVSFDGGAQVRWNPVGKELFYIAFDNQLMRVPIELGSPPEIGLSTKLFLTHVGGAVVSARPRYMVSADGQRFLMHTVENAPAAPINVILNWKPKF